MTAVVSPVMSAVMSRRVVVGSVMLVFMVALFSGTEVFATTRAVVALAVAARDAQGQERNGPKDEQQDDHREPGSHGVNSLNAGRPMVLALEAGYIDRVVRPVLWVAWAPHTSCIGVGHRCALVVLHVYRLSHWHTAV